MLPHYWGQNWTHHISIILLCLSSRRQQPTQHKPFEAWHIPLHWTSRKSVEVSPGLFAYKDPMVPKTFVQEVYCVSDSSMGTATMLSQTVLILWPAMVRGPYLIVHNSHLDSFCFSHNQKQLALLSTK